MNAVWLVERLEGAGIRTVVAVTGTEALARDWIQKNVDESNARGGCARERDYAVRVVDVYFGDFSFTSPTRRSASTGD